MLGDATQRAEMHPSSENPARSKKPPPGRQCIVPVRQDGLIDNRFGHGLVWPGSEQECARPPGSPPGCRFGVVKKFRRVSYRTFSVSRCEIPTNSPFLAWCAS